MGHYLCWTICTYTHTYITHAIKGAMDSNLLLWFYLWKGVSHLSSENDRKTEAQYPHQWKQEVMHIPVKLGYPNSLSTLYTRCNKIRSKEKNSWVRRWIGVIMAAFRCRGLLLKMSLFYEDRPWISFQVYLVSNWARTLVEPGWTCDPCWKWKGSNWRKGPHLLFKGIFL